MKKIKTGIIILFALVVVGCSDNEAKITITCNGDTIKAGIGAAGTVITSGNSDTWTREWDGGIGGDDKKSFTLYAKDWMSPLYNSATRNITVYDGDHYYWSIGWTKNANGDSIKTIFSSSEVE